MLSIRNVDPQGADAMGLLHEAVVDARALYPELFAGRQASATNGPPEERGIYVIAYVDGRPLACGAIRPLDAEVAEVRRMYVHREHRRQGLATAVLSHLVREARGLGYSSLVLETGYRQVFAMRFYEAHGFQRIAPFGEHVNDPTSVCYGRAIMSGGAVPGERKS
jgi:putative acetyltransferase